MSEFSYWWTTSGTPAGDQVASYTQAHLARIAAVLAACSGFEGVAPDYLNELAGTVAGANTVQINTGGAVVDGKVYDSDAAVNVNIPSASGGGNTRIDRIVLRASWSSFTVEITRIAGVDAASPTAPAITQTSGTTYDITLYQALVDTAGTVTLTDERVMAMVELDDDSVTDAKLRNSAAVSVIGRAANSAGNPADIAAAANDRVLARQSNALLFAQVATAMLANDSVDDTKVGNRVPQFYRRQGGSATNWEERGTTTYTPTSVRMQAGSVILSSVGATTLSVTITFPTAFSANPLVLATAAAFDSFGTDTFVAEVGPEEVGSSSVKIYVTRVKGSTTNDVVINWLAIGPE